MLRSARLAALLGALLMACGVDVRVPAGAVVACSTDDDCPGDLRCLAGTCAENLVNVPPSASLQAPARAPRFVDMALNVADPNGPPFGEDAVTLELSFQTASGRCPISTLDQTVSGLAAPRAGAALTRRWDAVADAGCGLTVRGADRDGDGAADEDVVAYAPAVTVAAAPRDASGATGNEVSAAMAIGNDPPVAVLELTDTAVSGEVAIPFSITDSSLDASSAHVQFALPEAPASWQDAAIKYGSLQHLTSDGAQLLVVWDSASSAGGVGLRRVAGVKLRLRAYDDVGGRDFGGFDEVVVDVDNQSPPSVEALALAGDGRITGAAYLTYRLFDAQSDLADVRVEYSLDEGATFSPCAELPDDLHGGRYQLATAPRSSTGGGVPHVFAWDVMHDLRAGVAPLVLVRVTPADLPAGAGFPAEVALADRLGLGAAYSGTAGFSASAATAANVGERAYLGDFNGDGVRDVLTGVYGSADASNTIYTLAGRTTAGLADGRFFGATGLALSLNDLRAHAVGSLNGDAYADAVLQDSSDIRVLLGGAGGLTLGPLIDNVGWAPRDRDLAIGDLDGDGNSDVVVWRDGGLAVLVGTGTTWPAGAQTYLAGKDVLRLAVGDVDDDGRDDLVALARTSHQRFEVLLARGVARVAAGDPVLAAASTVASDLAYYFEDDASVFVEEGVDVAVGDLDADGYGDIAVHSSPFATSSFVHVWEGEALGAGARVSEPTGDRARDMELADMDGDGRLDLVTFGCAGQQSVCVHIHQLAGGEVRRAAALGLPSTPCASFEWDGAAGDLNADGRGDLVISTRCAGMAGAVTTYLNAQGFELVFDDPGVIGAVSDAADELAAWDWNYDGALDAAVVDRGDLIMEVRSGSARLPAVNGATTLASAGSFDLNGVPSTTYYRHAIGDINRDGAPDLYVSEWDGESFHVLASTVAGDGSLGYGAPTQLATIATSSMAFVLGAADLNGDGFDDAVGNSSTVVRVARANVSGGVWQGSATMLTGPTLSYTPDHLAFGDFDGNGTLDVALGDGGSANVSVLSGNGTGALTHLCTRATPGNVRALAAADINADGLEDLIVGYVSTTSTAFATLNWTTAGCPAGLATQSSVTLVAAAITSLEVADLDADGVADLLGVGDAKAFVWRGGAQAGLASGSFGAPADVGLTGVRRAAARDFANDGVLDLVVATTAGELSIARGQRQSIASSWSRLLAPSERVAIALPAVDAFGEATSVSVLWRVHDGAAHLGEAPSRGFLRAARASGLAGLTDPALRPLSVPHELRGDRRLVRDEAAGRVRVVPAYAGAGGATAGFIVALPVIRALGALDLTPSGETLAVVARRDDYVRGADGNLPVDAGGAPLVRRTTTWQLIPRDPDGDLATGSGERYVVDGSGGAPSLRLYVERGGVIQAFYK